MTAAGDVSRTKIVEAIGDFARDNEYSPTVREIAEWVGLSKTTVYKHLLKLKAEGRVHCPRQGAGWFLT